METWYKRYKKNTSVYPPNVETWYRENASRVLTPRSTERPVSPARKLLLQLKEKVANNGPAMVRRVNGIIVLKLSEPDSVWTIDLKNGNGSVREGHSPPKAELTVSVEEKHLCDLHSGELGPAWAWTRGILKCQGDTKLAKKLVPMLRS